MLINVKDFMLYLNSDLSVYIKAFIELPGLKGLNLQLFNGFFISLK